MGLCGIPSIWRSPTTRQPGGSPRRNRRVHHLALPPGWRVVARREIDEMPHFTHLTHVGVLVVIFFRLPGCMCGPGWFGKAPQVRL